MPMIPIDSIELPECFMQVCADWAGGPGCLLRDVSTYRGLKIATTRPGGCDSDEKRYLALWRSFAADLHCTHSAWTYGFSECAVTNGLKALAGYVDW
jgi:hypothetical protein